MAAPRDGELLNFKSFVVRKKTEYSLRFPFLTERQILAKLRRVWECQKSSAVPRSRKREPVIDSPHVPHRVPITTTSKRGRNEKGDLSAFDVDCDTTIPCETLYTGRYSKCYKSTQPAESSLPNQLCITEHVSDSSYLSSRQLSCRGNETTPTDSNVPQELQVHVLPVNDTQRQPLHPLQTMTESTQCLPEKPLTNNSMTTRPTISPHLKSSLCTCTILCRKEAPLCQYCTINTLPFSSEAQHEHRVVMRNGKTQIPVMANRITRGNLKHVSTRRERGIRDSEAGLHRAGSPSQFRDSISCENTKSGAEDVLSGQPVSPGEDTGLTPVSGSPTIQSLPNLGSDTPDRDSTTLGSTPLASSADTITTITVFDSLSRGTSGTPSPRNKSNSPPHDSEVSIVPLSCNSDTLRDNQINSPPSRTPAGTTRPQFQRYRLKRKSRTRSLWLCNSKTASCLSEGSVGQFNDENTHIESVTDTSLMQQCSVYGDEEAVNPKKKQKFSEDCVVEFRENNSVGSSGLYSATDEEMEKHRQALEQIVPEDTIPLPQNGCPTYSSDHRQQERSNLMCDMFQLLTPDRPTLEPHKDGPCLGGDQGVPSSSATSRRRVFRSATTESKSNFYSMFMDESDIFM